MDLDEIVEEFMDVYDDQPETVHGVNKYFPVQAVVVSKGVVPIEYKNLPLLNEGFDFDLAHKLGLSGVIRVYDCFLEATRFIDVGEETFTYTPLGSVEISDKDLKSLPRTKPGVITTLDFGEGLDVSGDGDTTTISVKRNKKVDVPTESWQKAVDRRLDSHALALEKLISKEYHTGS